MAKHMKSKGKAGKCMLAVPHFGKEKGSKGKTGTKSSPLAVPQFGKTSRG